MAKTVIKESGSVWDSYGTLFFEKQPGEETVELAYVPASNASREASDAGAEIIGRLKVASSSKELVFDLEESSNIVVRINGLNVEEMGSAKRRNPSADTDDAHRNWEIVEVDATDEEAGKRVFRTWLPNGAMVEIDTVEPGPYTPAAEDVREILGQPEMVFDLALSVALGKHSLLTGPTGVGKTEVYRWLAHQLGYNFILMPITRGTQDRHMLGEYAPAGPGNFEWTDGPVTQATRLSTKHPTILMFDELNRIGNVAEYSRIYSLLDGSRIIELPEKRQSDGTVERIKAGKLFIGATANPIDDEGGDYVGVRELDPAFVSRLPIQPTIAYPEPDIEKIALMDRVPALSDAVATKIVDAANRIRSADEIRFPISFRELEAWALVIPYHGFASAAERTVVSKAPAVMRVDVRNLLGVL